MANIREELTLVDNFSGTFNQFNTAASSATSLADRFKGALDEFKQGFFEGLTEALTRTNDELDEAANGSQRVARHTKDAEQAQKKVTAETEASARAAEGWGNAIKGAVTALGVGTLVKTFVETADEMTLINSRLDAINDNIFKETSLQNEVYQAALRSRGAYQDTAELVARIGQNAGDLFNNAEAVKFAETMNKAFKLGGASQNEISSATLQLSQALATGILRGEEFNAVNEAAPSVIRRIADEMGVPVSQMREMAQQGQITAAVVKNAMLNAADEIDADFANLPKTFQDYVTQGKNMVAMGISDIQEQWTEFLNTPQGAELFNDVISAVVTFAQIGSEAFLAIANGIAWVRQNWEQILPIIEVAGAAILAYAAIQVGSALMSAAAWAVANWQLILVVGIAAAVIAAIHSTGVAFQDVGRVAGQVIGILYASISNVFITLWNGVIAPFAEFFANVFNDPVNAIVNLFASAFSAVLGFVTQVASAIDNVLGSNLAGAISGFRNDFMAGVEAKYANQTKVERMDYVNVRNTMDEFGDIGANLGGRLDEMNLSLNGIMDAAGGISDSMFNLDNNIGGTGEVGKVGSVGKIDNDVTLSDEDLQIYRDLAEQRYMNNIELKTLAPNINVSIPEGTNLSPEDVANYIKSMLIEQMAANAATAH